MKLATQLNVDRLAHTQKKSRSGFGPLQDAKNPAGATRFALMVCENREAMRADAGEVPVTYSCVSSHFVLSVHDPAYV